MGHSHSAEQKPSEATHTHAEALKEIAAPAIAGYHSILHGDTEECMDCPSKVASSSASSTPSTQEIDQADQAMKAYNRTVPMLPPLIIG